MICPKCTFKLPELSETCPACGVIFAKLHAPAHPVEHIKPPAIEAETETVTPAGLLLGERSGASGWLSVCRGMLWVGLLIWGVTLVWSTPASNTAGESLLHLINLPFHEAGHFFFRPFGQFLTTLGGSLGQLLVPLICLAVLLLKTRDPFGASVCLWWLGESLLDLAPYINDARTGVMPLLGGNTGQDSPYGFHDWEYLLTETSLLAFDHRIAWLAHLTGAALMLMALGWGLGILFRGFNRNRTNKTID